MRRRRQACRARGSDNGEPVYHGFNCPKLPREPSKASKEDIDLESESDISESDDLDDDTEDKISSDYDDGYSEAYKDNIEKEEVIWSHYCQQEQKQEQNKYIQSDPKKTLQLGVYKPLHRYFNWRLKLKKGIDGRRLKGIKKLSSLEILWKNFLRYYERSRGHSLNRTTIQKWKE
ncbi:hypothetical protein FQN57_005381 [Myotisia sp. PD_48]|nr:hypothetical protein FQN57_005381 [Myotisia sp. PD_48]